MIQVEFKFRPGDWVRTDLGEIGVVSVLFAEGQQAEFRFYGVQTNRTFSNYVEYRLTLTDDRPFPEMSTGTDE